MSDQYPNGNIIFHIDMNSFYASVEVANHPELKGQPLAIAGRAEERRGIVVTSSYEARAQGVKTTMPVWEAKRLCPGLIVRHPDFPLYRETSQQIFAILKDYTNLVQKVSIDEGYMDVTNSDVDMHPVKLARQIQNRILQEIGIPSSIGIAPNKFLAKMASDMQKPLGLTILRKRDMSEKLWKLPIGDMHGVGSKTEGKLRGLNIDTIGDLANTPALKLTEWFGVQGGRLHERANGHDARPVDPYAEHTFKSIGQSTTLSRDTTETQVVRQIFGQLASKLEAQLRQKQVCAYHLSMMIRYSNWQTITRATMLSQPVFRQDDLVRLAMELFDHHWDGRPLRLLGITTSSFENMATATKQLDLFSYENDAKQEPINHTIDELNDKYGKTMIKRGNQLYRNDQSE